MARTRNQKNIEIPSPQFIKDQTLRRIIQSIKDAIELGSAKAGAFADSYVTKDELRSVGILRWDGNNILFNPNAEAPPPFTPAPADVFAGLIFRDGSFVTNRAGNNLIVKV